MTHTRQKTSEVKNHSIGQQAQMKNWTWLGSVMLVAFQWIVIHATGIHLAPHWQALSAGIGIFGAAFLLSWAAELAQLDIPQSLALVFLALIAVLPEYAVDMYFAWHAGKDPQYTAYALANMTGANRLLIGVGWACVILTFWLKTGQRSFKLDRDRNTDIFYLALATVYSLILPFKRRLELLDAVVLVTIFILYIRAASKAAHVEPELEGPPEMIARLRVSGRRLCTGLLFVLSGYTIFTAAEPFAEGLLETGRNFGIEEFLLIQWLAPLASESPEFIVAILFALRANPGASMGTLLSSKVNQWTLLVGMLPLVYMASAGGIMPMNMDDRQMQEVLLTAAQSFFAVIILSNLSFSVLEGVALFLLFAAQLITSDASFRTYYSILYIALGLGLILFKASYRNAVFRFFKR